ncbi:MAG TPA: cupredoxin domain-containing protein [Stellaceae bacterium]|jgi:plastocyanin
MKYVSLAAALGLGLICARAEPLRAEDTPAPIDLTVKDHRFDPAEIHVKAGQPAVINMHNQDSTAEEFDSDSLGVEKVIAGGRSGVVHLHALAPGKYPFMGEYHSDTAQGVVIAE